MTPAELDALEARLATIDDEVWTILGGNANVTMGHIKALRAAAPQLIASARALESLRRPVADWREYNASICADIESRVVPPDSVYMLRDEALNAILNACLALFPEET